MTDNRRTNAPQSVQVAHPATGWILAPLGGLIVVGAFLPWATALNGVLNHNGIDGGSDGILTLILGLGMVGVGVVIGIHEGRMWAPVVCGLLAAAVVGVFMLDLDDISTRQYVSVGGGLWMTGLAGLIGVLTAIVACFTLQPKIPEEPPGWHSDPWHPGALRWWNGTQWSTWVSGDVDEDNTMDARAADPTWGHRG